MNAIEILKENGIITDDFNSNYTLTKFNVSSFEVKERELPCGWNEKVFLFVFDNPTHHPSAEGVVKVICENETGEYEIYDIQ